MEFCCLFKGKNIVNLSLNVRDAMFKARIWKPSKSGIISDQRGDTLIENLVAIVLLSIIVVAVFMAIGTAIRSFGELNTNEASKDIAASEMDYIYSQPYAASYTIFNPSSGPTGTVITVPAGSGWSSPDTSFSVTIGSIPVLTNTLTLNGSNNLTGTITVPSGVTAGFQTIIITGKSTGNSQTFANAFNVATGTAQYPPEYAGYTSSLSVTQIQPTEQQIVINISTKGSVVYTLTDYRTYY
jgi:type II secretory pathway pseudopilin PulG